MAITIDQIKKLRDETGISLTEIKKALEESNGDIEKAKDALRIVGQKTLYKKTDRETKAGLIEAYVHPTGTTGVIVDIRCESDFVAKNPDFKNLAHEICLQIAAMKPLCVKEDEIAPELLEREKNIAMEQLKGSGKPEKIVNQVLEGKLNKYKAEISLMSQPWVKDDSKTIKNLIEDVVGKIGENIEIKRFARFEIA